MSIWSDIEDRSEGTSGRAKEMYDFKDPSVISPAKLQEMLKTGIVHFQYRKKPKKGQPEDSGEIRDAWGTKQMTIVSKIPYGGDCPPKRVGYSIYFDLEKEDWRAFAEWRLIGVCPKILTQDEFNKILPTL